MCTVTYIPSGNQFFLSSNRDEKRKRLPALAPQWYPFVTGHLLFPKDATAGGTWMALHENGNAMVLLNGAFVNHQPAPQCRKSRGLIFLDLFDHPEPIRAFQQLSLHEIEPFTLVLRQQDQLFETRWDGFEKFIRELDPTGAYIWSSVTLYGSDIIEKRKQWFDLFLNSKTSINQTDILQFHRFGGDGDTANDITMNRSNELLTVSITSLHQLPKRSILRYYDLQNQREFNEEVHHTKPVPANEQSR